MWFRLSRLFRPVDRIICLTEPVELDTYLSNYGSEENRRSVESFKAKVVRQMMVGDQLWNYHTRGFHRRCGMQGLALVRGGHVVKTWGLWIS